MHLIKKTSGLIIYSCFCLFSSGVIAQEEKAGIFSMKTGQSSDSEVTRSQPAKAIATFPRDTTNSSYSINGFLEFGFNFPDNNQPKRSISLILEQHKNTLIAKEQDVFQIGVQWQEIFFFDRSTEYKPKLSLSLKHTKDNINDKRGLQILGYLSLYPANANGENFWDALLQNDFVHPGNERERDLNGEFPWSDIIQIGSTHSLGIEHLNYESLSLLHFAYNLELYPFSGLLYQLIGQYQLLRLDLGADFRTKIGYSDSTLFTGNSIKGAIGLNVFLDEESKQSIGVSYSYQEGGDPLKGLADQAFSQLSISAIFSLDSTSKD